MVEKFILKPVLLTLLLRTIKYNPFNLQNGEEMTVNRVILATGHSARDIFYLLV